MKLREGKSKKQKKIDNLIRQNTEFKEKIDALEMKAGIDCETILKQVKELDHLTTSHK